VEVNQHNSFGTTPLHFSAANGHLGCIQLLLAAGAQANAFETDGSTPLLGALREGHVGVVERAPRVEGIRLGKVDYPATYPNKAGLDGAAPLHVASVLGNLEVVALILGAGADKDQTTLNRLETLSTTRAWRTKWRW
jgi:ankyrin repeat protein